jgi:hypothetical protein
VEENRPTDVPGEHAEAEETAAETNSGRPATAEEQEMLNAARRITAEVARARHLTMPKEFDLRLIDRDEVREFVAHALHEEMGPEQIELLGRVEASLGVIPLGSDAERLLLDMYEEGVLGIYDPKKKTLLIGDFVGKSMLGMVVGHEAAHGIQDMHFDLEALQETHDGESDRDSARTFLVEGDAQAAYLAWVAGDDGLGAIGDDVLLAQANMSLELAGSASRYPVLARMMQMPYTDGTSTIIQLARRDGFEAVDALFDKLPETTEQMLHLDKLAAREPAKPVLVNWDKMEAAAPGHTVVWADELGESALLAMLAEVEGADQARRGAAGWGGDRYIALDRPEQATAPIVVGMIVWDSKSDAREFEPMLRSYFERTLGEDFFVARKGDKVIYATQMAGNRKSLEREAWKAFRVGKPGAKRRPPPAVGGEGSPAASPSEGATP